MTGAIVFLVAPRALVLLDDVLLVLVHREARGDAGLLVPAHAQTVEVERRLVFDHQRRAGRAASRTARAPSRRPAAEYGSVPGGRSISERVTCRKLSGLPAASWRASSVPTTSYGTDETAAALSRAGRKARNGRMAAIRIFYIRRLTSGKSTRSFRGRTFHVHISRAPWPSRCCSPLARRGAASARRRADADRVRSTASSSITTGAVIPGVTVVVTHEPTGVVARSRRPTRRGCSARRCCRSGPTP